jgi:DNA-directed RNA polymerase subunit RPC12/RpoP
MKDAPSASNTEPYKCGDGEKNFYVPPDSTEYNQYARCSECFSKTLQVIIKSFS